MEDPLMKKYLAIILSFCMTTGCLSTVYADDLQKENDFLIENNNDTFELPESAILPEAASGTEANFSEQKEQELLSESPRC